MSFSVSYTYKIIDKFTPQLREIERQTEAFNKRIQGLAATVNTAGKGLQDMGRQAEGTSRIVKTAGVNISKGLDRIQPETLTKRFGNLSGKMNQFATSAGALASTLGGGMLLKKFGQDAMALENSVVDLTKVFEFADAKALDDFQASLGDIARKTGQSKAAMNAMAYEAGKLGIALSEVGGFAEMAGMAAVAFKVDLPQATDYLSDLRVKLSLNNKALRETLDTINYIDDAGEASSQGMLEIMARFSGQASALKIAPDVMAAFAATAEKLEISPAKAASGLEMMVQRLQDVKKFDPGVAAGLASDFSGTINAVINKLKGMDRVARNLAVQDLFGNEAAGFVLNFIDKQDLLNKNLALSADKLKAVGSMAREFGKQSQTASFKMLQMNAGLTDVSASIGQTLLPHLITFANWIGVIVPKIQEWVKQNPGVTQFVLAVGAATVALAPLALALSSFLSIAGVGISIFAKLAPLFSGLAPLVAGFMTPLLPLAAVAVSMWSLYQSAMLTLEVLKGFSGVGFGDTIKSLGNALAFWKDVDDPSMNLAMSKTSTSTAMVGGNIGVTVDGPGKVTSANLGPINVNRGTNVAGKLP